MLQVKQASKIYEGKIAYRALTDINLTIDKGEFVGIMGPSGSGKTTLLNMIATIDEPTTGEILISGENWVTGLILVILVSVIIFGGIQRISTVASFFVPIMAFMMNSHWLLILLYIGGLIPMNTYLMKGYMDSIPIDLDESAKIDGASNTRIFLQIIMPLSKPMIAVVAMNGFTGPLGDFVLSSTILRTPESYTLPIGLYNLVNEVMGASYT